MYFFFLSLLVFDFFFLLSISIAFPLEIKFDFILNVITFIWFLVKIRERETIINYKHTLFKMTL